MQDSLLVMGECKIAGILWNSGFATEAKHFFCEYLATGSREDGAQALHEAPVCMYLIMGCLVCMCTKEEPGR